MIKKCISLFLTVLLMGLLSMSSAASALSLPYWRLSYNNIDSNIANVSIDKNERHSGKGSLKIKYTSGAQANHYLQAFPNGDSVEVGEQYIISFWAKSENSGTVRTMWNWTTVDRLSGTFDWKYFEKTYIPTENSMLFNFIVETNSCIWIDDVSIRKAGSDTQLLYNGGMESCDYTPPDEVSETNVKELDGQLELSWKNPVNSDFYGVSVYGVAGDENEETLIAGITDGSESYTVQNLRSGQVYTFILKTEDKYGNVSSGVYVFGKTVTENLNTQNLTQNYNQQAKTLTVSVRVTNITYESGLDAELIVAVYDENGILTGINGQKHSIGIGLGEDYTVTVENVSSGYKSEIYLWDSAENFCPLVKPL